MDQESGSFYTLFKSHLAALEARANAVGSTITELCRESKIARATPDRWRARAPKSVELMDELEKAVVQVEKRAAEKNQS